VKNARPQTAETSALDKRDSTEQSGAITNPREQRAAVLLMRRPATRTEIDDRAGCANGPDLIARIRRRTGADIPCERIEALDRDGRPCRPGVYSLTAGDRRKLSRWLASRRAT
jgi:hypothetical protein